MLPLIFEVVELIVIIYFLMMKVMDTWLAYAPVKNNPEDAAKVHCFLLNVMFLGSINVKNIGPQNCLIHHQTRSVTQKVITK